MGFYLFDWLKARKIIKDDSITEDITNAFNEQLKALESKLNFRIKNKKYFIKALTHRSYLEVSDQSIKSNERLEFLGDAVLGLVVANYLFLKYPEYNEGALTKFRTHLVNKNALAKAAESFALDEFIIFDKRYLNGTVKGKKSINADALEALIGAIYLEKGLKEAEKFIIKWIVVPNIESGEMIKDRNFKGQLLEYAHSNKMETPVYNIINEEGPEHEKCFTVEVKISGERVGVGSGKNKKSAEQDAANNALIELKKTPTNK